MTITRAELAPGYEISRIIKGGWQLAVGHGTVPLPVQAAGSLISDGRGLWTLDPISAVEDMFAFLKSGITTFDCADIYTGVEELIGEFRKAFLKEHGIIPANIWFNQIFRVHTKFVPDLDVLQRISHTYVESVIDRSRSRLGLDCLDLIQFHWWDYEIPGYVQTARWLAELQRKGKIRHIGLTNFDTTRMFEIVSTGIHIVSNQVQYSLLDPRPENAMVKFCLGHNIKLLCYGTLAGGFISEKWLGVKEPQEPLENRSLTKYKLIIDEFGGWGLFQELLTILSLIARKHNASIANIAMRYVLDKPLVAGIIVGARDVMHLDNLEKTFSFEFDREDQKAIYLILDRSAGPMGDIYDLERVKGGKHASIIKYTLNK